MFFRLKQREINLQSLLENEKKSKDELIKQQQKLEEHFSVNFIIFFYFLKAFYIGCLSL